MSPRDEREGGDDEPPPDPEAAYEREWNAVL
jgi:hypothetical protein